ncbi:caspase family protein [Xanthomonas arboricola]|uniref:caspase family protein n=1 Tax=Xanthomonas arboricola TaxID=56448 RepID=UPI000F8CA04D|nr:caspase family protein [Xanthomonas arboricola]
MRKALIIGVDYYASGGSLFGCVNDAHRVAAMLESHSDGSPNFDVRLITASSDRDQVTFRKLKDLVAELFKSDDDIALFYFAGHGHVEATGGYICGSDSRKGDEGLALSEIMALAGQSAAKNKIVILDSCHSGAAGADPLKLGVSEVTTGTTILTASRADEGAAEVGGSGVFTDLLVDALGGAAANLVGEVTPGSVYAHIDQSLGSWAQRPVFKTNVSGFVSLRKVRPPIDPEILRALPALFPDYGFQLQLDPSFEPELPSRGLNPIADPEKTKIFSQLQKLNRVNLLLPNTQTHMYHAAINSDTVRLTALGEHYRRLALKKRI